MAPGQEAGGDNLGMEYLFDILKNNGMLSVLIRIASIRGWAVTNVVRTSSPTPLLFEAIKYV